MSLQLIKKSTNVRFYSILGSVLLMVGCASAPQMAQVGNTCPIRHTLTCTDFGAGPEQCQCVHDHAMRERFRQLPELTGLMGRP